MRVFYHDKKSYKEVDCSGSMIDIESFLMREAASRVQNEGANVKKRQDKFIDRCIVFTSVRIKLTPGVESAQWIHLDGEEEEDALGHGCVPRANKSAGYTDGTSMYKAGVVRRVNNGRREKKTRAFGRQTRAVLKRGIAIYGADLLALALCENKSRGHSRAENRFDIRSTVSPRVTARGKWERGGKSSACRGNRRFALNLLRRHEPLERASTLNSAAQQRHPVTMRRYASGIETRITISKPEKIRCWVTKNVHRPLPEEMKDSSFAIYTSRIEKCSQMFRTILELLRVEIFKLRKIWSSLDKLLTAFSIYF